MKCVILEDEPSAIELISGYIARTPELELITSFREPLKALSFLRSSKVDLLFLDINMPDLSGMDLLNVLSNPPLVIFTTAYAEYAIESYEKNAVDYLLKPIEFQRFLQGVEKAKDRLSHSDSMNPTEESRKSENSIYIKSGTQSHRIDLNQVRFLEKEGHYILFHLPGKKLIARLSMKDVFELISREDFIQVHKSYIVAKQFVQVIETQQIRIDQHVIPIGKTFRKAVNQFFGNK